MSYPVPSSEGTPFASQEWMKVMIFLKNESKGDKPTLWSAAPQWEMSQVHLIFLSLFARMYLFAEYAVERGDLANYLGFAEVVLFNVYKHHSTEETAYYNKMAEAAGVDHWSHNAVEHHTFDQNLEAAMLYVRYCRQNLTPTPSPSPIPEPSPALVAIYDKYPNLDADKPFDPQVFRKHLDEIIVIFGQHMVDGIETLRQDKVEQIGEKNLVEINAGIQKVLMAYGPEWFLCPAYASVPPAVINQFIVLPFIVRRVLLPLLWGPKYAAWWKYCPYPENLTFFGKA